MILRQIAAMALWLAAAIPLNLFVLSAFVRLSRHTPRAGPGRPPAGSDDQRIRRFVEDNLDYIWRRRGDEGLGTRYERMMVDRLLLRIARQHGVRKALESPADGITGVPGANSLALAGVLDQPMLLCSPSSRLLESARGTWQGKGMGGRIKVLRAPIAKIPLADGGLDLAWSFCMLEKLSDPAGYLREMARVSSNLVLAVAVNDANPGNALHRRYHRLTGGEWDHGSRELSRTGGLERVFRLAGLEVLEAGAVDAPPSWDTQDMPLKDDIQRVAGWLGKRWEWGLDTDAGDAGGLGFFRWLEDGLPPWFRRRIAHHLYVLGTVRRAKAPCH
jgi:SAM-dependent methyltransferase